MKILNFMQPSHSSKFSLLFVLIMNLETRINFQIQIRVAKDWRIIKNNNKNFGEVIKLFFFICFFFAFYFQKDVSNHTKMRRPQSINFIDQTTENSLVCKGRRHEGALTLTGGTVIINCNKVLFLDIVGELARTWGLILVQDLSFGHCWSEFWSPLFLVHAQQKDVQIYRMESGFCNVF